jgi:uncharacterized protein YndB with AHSA1/START domain
MPDISRSITVARSPEEVWAVIGDPLAVAEWLPMIASARMDGDLRVAAVEGGEITERILEHSDPERYYTYQVVDGPMRLDSYLSKLSVAGDGVGAVVSWECDFEPPPGKDKDRIAAGIDKTYESGLASLRGILER